MLIAFSLLVACLAIMVTASLVFPETLKEEARPLDLGRLARAAAR